MIPWRSPPQYRSRLVRVRSVPSGFSPKSLSVPVVESVGEDEVERLRAEVAAVHRRSRPQDTRAVFPGNGRLNGIRWSFGSVGVWREAEGSMDRKARNATVLAACLLWSGCTDSDDGAVTTTSGS